MTDLQRSIIRTTVPQIVGALIIWASRLGVELDSAALTAVVTPFVGAAYYAVVRLLEEYVGPVWGILLGAKGAPAYQWVWPEAYLGEKP